MNEIVYKIEVNKVELDLKISIWGYIKYKIFKLNKDEAFKEFAQEIWKKASDTTSKNLQEAMNSTKKVIETQYKVKGEI